MMESSCLFKGCHSDLESRFSEEDWCAVCVNEVAVNKEIKWCLGVKWCDRNGKCWKWKESSGSRQMHEKQTCYLSMGITLGKGWIGGGVVAILMIDHWMCRSSSSYTLTFSHVQFKSVTSFPTWQGYLGFTVPNRGGFAICVQLDDRGKKIHKKKHGSWCSAGQHQHLTLNSAADLFISSSNH